MKQRETYLTPNGVKQLRDELDHLKKVRRQEVAYRIHEASESGGTVDNAEYDEAKNEQAFAEGRILNLESILSKAVVTATRKPNANVVGIGSSVSVVTAGGGKRRYSIVGSAEASPLEGKISNESPVGRALIGLKTGDSIDVKTPSGIMELTITKIR